MTPEDILKLPSMPAAAPSYPLGPYRFTVSLGESQQLDLSEPVTGEAMLDYLRALPHSANSGDVYALLQN